GAARAVLLRSSHGLTVASLVRDGKAAGGACSPSSLIADSKVVKIDCSWSSEEGYEKRDRRTGRVARDHPSRLEIFLNQLRPDRVRGTTLSAARHELIDTA